MKLKKFKVTLGNIQWIMYSKNKKTIKDKLLSSVKIVELR